MLRSAHSQNKINREETNDAHDAFVCIVDDGPHRGSDCRTRPDRRRSEERRENAGQCAGLRHGLFRQPLQPAHQDHQGQRRQAGSGMVVFACGPARRRSVSDRRQRRRLRDDPRFDRGRRRHHRQADLARQTRISAGHAARGLLRHRQSRRGDLPGHDHPRADGRSHRCARRQDRQPGLGSEIARSRRAGERLCDDRRTADRQRRRDCRRRRRRVQPTRLHRRLRCRDRQAFVADLHDPGQGRTRLRDLARRFRADRRRLQAG